MDAYYGLSQIEYEFMELFWRSAQPLGFADVKVYCTEEKGHSWTKTTIHTYLTNLIGKGMLASSKESYRHTYWAVVSKEELIHRWSSRFVETSFNGSLKNLLVSFSYGKKLSREECDELHRFLDSNCVEEEEDSQ